MLTEEFFKILEDANFTAENIPLYREQINAEVAKRGEDASQQLIFLADFLNSANAGFGDMVGQGATFNFSDEIAAKFQDKVPQNLCCS